MLTVKRRDGRRERSARDVFAAAVRCRAPVLTLDEDRRRDGATVRPGRAEGVAGVISGQRARVSVAETARREVCHFRPGGEYTLARVSERPLCPGQGKPEQPRDGCCDSNRVSHAMSARSQYIAQASKNLPVDTARGFEINGVAAGQSGTSEQQQPGTDTGVGISW